MDEHEEIEGLGAVQERLRRLGTNPVDMARQSADLTAMASVRPHPGVRRKLRVAGVFLAGLLIGSSGLAAADALPDPAQHAAHTVLSRVGVDVPDPERYHGPECGAEAKRNHGAYVRDDHTLAKSDCGKTTKAAGVGDDVVDEPKGGKGPCTGKPAWAGDSTSSPEEKAAQRAERRALCGADGEGELEDDPASTQPEDAEDADDDDSSATTTSITG